MAYDSQFGGVSAVNPQARGDYNQYIDAAFRNAQQRLNPIFGQQRQAYEQAMINRGLPVGGSAYNQAFQQLDQNQNDAWQNAAFGAMRFGTDLQQQDYSQDLGRSQLANALLQSKWGDLTSRYGIDQSTGLGYANLGEQGRQFDQSLGQRDYEFNTGMDQRGYEFDRGLDYQYYDTDNRYDLLWNQFMDDQYRWEAGQGRQDYYDQQQADLLDWNQLMQLLGLGGQPGVYTQDPTAAYNAQLGAGANIYGSQMNLLGQLFGGGMMPG